MDSAMMKMHVPTYWPGLLGVQSSEKSGVRDDVKKVMAMSAMDMVMWSCPPISMADVDEAMAAVDVMVMSIV